ncbi:kinesin-like protein KIF14 isoform X1 [Homalodisca vitripennis]|uniref:kinesin-like protein KIF14 isoform X1 n=1 Tax=Homalodisca vitripennis TaxID=197043 RepID=UPI001EEC0B6A|nr:kinesin-like protein KIF14 isoform X1 [Homalodisca vitripennis]
MSKSTAIFSRTPVKNVKSSPASSRPNSASKTARNQATPTKTEPSPRKCRVQTEIQNTTGDVKVRSRMQLSYQVTKSSPRKVQDQIQAPGSAGGVKPQTSRGDPISAKNKLDFSDSNKVDEPLKVNVKSMRSCFEKKEPKVQCRPPPSPSPSRVKCRLVESAPMTPRITNLSNIRGILTSKSKYDNTPTFRVPSGGNTPTPRTSRLRRSVSTGALAAKVEDSPASGAGRLARSSSQTITPKHVKFQDEATPECFSPVLLDSRTEMESVDCVAGETTNLTVAVRVRPPFTGILTLHVVDSSMYSLFPIKCKKMERSVVSVENNTVRVKALGSEHCFSYDFCFPSTGDAAASQQDVFHTLVEPLVDVAFQGYNVCLFAYGQTGSGKSYSMMGEDTADGVGIIPRFSQQLFKIIESSEEYSHTKVEISYFEIYNEKIHDLLGPAQNGRSAPLRVREHPELGPYVVDLTVHNVHSFEILQDWLRVGNSHKATAATEMNMNSSRSHSIFTVTLTQSQAEDRPSLCSKINLIDLAGSERLAHTCATGDRLKEGVSINRSLLTLGKVISSLAENKKRGFIPYRESVLTWLLRVSTSLSSMS